MKRLVLTSTTMPYSYRVLFTMLSTVAAFFGRDHRITTALALVYSEIDDIATSDEDFDALIDTAAVTLKMQRHICRETDHPLSPA
jgi:hypothetical protein